jgi:hypothetical protein
MGSACSTNGEKRNAYGILVKKPEEKRPLGRPRCRWVDNIRETEWGGMGWIDLARSGTDMNLRIPYNVGKFLNSYTTGGSSRKVRLHEVSFLNLNI